MKKAATVFFGAVLLCPSGLWAQEDFLPVERSPLDRAINTLSSDSYHDREAASKALWEFGESAVEALSAAATSPDPEVAHRARVLLDRIRTGIGPETPAKIVDLVQKYAQGNLREKRRVLEELERMNAYPQVLRLYHFEEDENVREECLEVVEESVMPAVLMALRDNDEEEAIGLLKIAPRSDVNFRRLAALYREMGQLEEMILGLEESREKPEDSALLLACLRANGDLEKAIALAGELERMDLVGALEILDGNPVPFVQWRINDPSTSTVERLHMEIVLESWYGNGKQARRLARPMADMARGVEESSAAALRSLLLNGHLQEAIEVMKDGQELNLFAYHDIMEEPWKALDLLDYPRDPEKRVEWREGYLEFLMKDWDFHSLEAAEYFSIIDLLYQRGAEEEALALLRPVMQSSQEAGGEHWESYLNYVALQGEGSRAFAEMGFLLLSEEISPETEERRVRGYLTGVTGREDSVNAIWKALRSREGLSLKDCFLAYAKVYGFISSEEEEFEELWAFLIECAEGKREPKVSYHELLLGPAEARGDTKLIIELLEILSEQEDDPRYQVPLANYYSFHHRWEESEKTWAALMPDNGVGNRFLASYAGVLLRLGREEEAQATLARLESKNLDDPYLLTRIADSLEDNGAWDLAATYWRQILLTTEPSNRYWNAAVERLNRDAKVKKEWRLASSLAMVQNAVAINGESSDNRAFLNLRKFFYMNFYRALDEMENGKENLAKDRLERGVSVLIGDGILADDFFPILREQGYTKLHDAFFERAYARFAQSINDFPKAHNSRNGAAWLASRASRRLDEAEAHVSKALALHPRQAAYLDTMAEVWFARHNREEAISWSTRALTDSRYAGHGLPGGAELRAQHDRFLSGEYPAR